MLISGYFSCKSRKTVLQKPVDLLIQVILFSSAWAILTGVLKGSLTAKGLLGSLVPANYFVILYITVYLLSPYLNLMYEKINKNFIVLTVILFSVWPTFVEVFCQITGKEFNGLSTIGMYGSQWGYQIVNFILMYFVGMFIRKYIEELNKIKISRLMTIFVCVVTLIALWASVSEAYGFNRNMAWIYCNPLVILEAVILFLLFSKFDIGCNKLINKFASASFTVFLVHNYVITHIKIEWAVSQNPIIMLGHVTGSAILIYCLCYLIDVIYKLFENLLFKRIKKKEIVISQL